MGGLGGECFGGGGCERISVCGGGAQTLKGPPRASSMASRRFPNSWRTTAAAFSRCDGWGGGKAMLVDLLVGGFHAAWAVTGKKNTTSYPGLKINGFLYNKIIVAK